MERDTSMLSSILHGLASVKSGVASILSNAFGHTTLPPLYVTTPCSTCGSLTTSEEQNENCIGGCSATTVPVSGTTSTPTTPEQSSTLYDIIEQAAIETADVDVLSWEQGLRAKYGIPQAMEKA